MIKQALAMDRQKKAGNDESDGRGDDDGDARVEEARMLLVQAFAEEDEAVQEDGENNKKRKRPAGTDLRRLDDHPETKTLRLSRSALSLLFPQIFTNPRLLHDLFLAPMLLASGQGGDLGALALTCKAFAPLRHEGTTKVDLGLFQMDTLKYPTRFIAALASPGSASVLTTLHVFDHILSSAELCYELGDVFAQGLPVLRELNFEKSHEISLWVSWEG